MKSKTKLANFNISREQIESKLEDLFKIKSSNNKLVDNDDAVICFLKDIENIENINQYGYVTEFSKKSINISNKGSLVYNVMMLHIFLPIKIWQYKINNYISSVIPAEVAVVLPTFMNSTMRNDLKEKFKYDPNMTDQLWWMNKFIPIENCVLNPYMIGMIKYNNINNYDIVINEYSPIERIEINYLGNIYRYHDFVLIDRYIMNTVDYNLVNNTIRFQDIVSFNNLDRINTNCSSIIINNLSNTVNQVPINKVPVTKPVVEPVQLQPQTIVQPQPIQQPINCTPMAQPTFEFTPLQPQPQQVQPQPVQRPMVNVEQVPAQPVEYIQPVYTDPNTGARFTGFKQPVYTDVQSNPTITNFNNNQAIPNYNNMNYSDPNRDQMIADTLIKLKDTLIDMKNDIDAEKQRQAAEKSVNNHPISAA